MVTNVFENKSTKRLAVMLRVISVVCIISPWILFTFYSDVGFGVEPLLHTLLYQGFLSFPLFIFLMLRLYLSAIPVIVIYLLVILSLILTGFTTSFLGQFLWDISPIANKFGEAKDKLLKALTIWRKEKPVKLIIGVSSIILCAVAIYILFELFFKVIIFNHLNYYFFDFPSTPLIPLNKFGEFAALSLTLLIITFPFSIWFLRSITRDARLL